MRRCCTRMSTASAPNRCSRPKSPTSSARRPCRPSSFDPKEPRMSRRPLALALALAVLLPASASAEDLLQTYELARTGDPQLRSEEHTSELQSLMRTSYAVFCLQKKKY